MAMIPFFRRSGGPLVSVMIPTRDRPGQLREAMVSLIEKAAEPNCMEFVLAIDDDDAATWSAIPSLAPLAPGRIKCVVTESGNMYADMHHRINLVAANSTGDWLMLFNDDSRMLTPTWDYVLLNAALPRPWWGVDDVCQLLFSTKGLAFDYGFPCIRRRAVELLGHFSRRMLADTWVYTINEFMGTCVHTTIELEHIRTEDETKWRSEHLRFLVDCDIRSVEARQEMLLDAEVLLKHMISVRDANVWQDAPDVDGWWWWRKDDESYASMAAVCLGLAEINIGGKMIPLNNSALFLDQLKNEPLDSLGGRWCLRRGE